MTLLHLGNGKVHRMILHCNCKALCLTAIWQDCEFSGKFTLTFRIRNLSLTENNRLRSSQPSQVKRQGCENFIWQ
jgi:hypothetical protein